MKLSPKIFALLCTTAVSLLSTAVLAQAPQPAAGSAANATQSQPPVFAAAGAKSYHVELNFSNNDVSLKEIDLADTPYLQRAIQPLTGWRCDVIALGNIIENSFLFDIPLTTCSDTPGKDAGLTGGCVSKDKASFSIEVPYYENGVGIEFTRPDGKNYYINTIGFAKLCGDNICESDENYSTCAVDCRSGVRDGYCDGMADGTCDPDCFTLSDKGASEDSDCQTVSAYAPGTQVAWWIVGGLVLVLIAGIFVSRKKKANYRK